MLPTVHCYCVVCLLASWLQALAHDLAFELFLGDDLLLAVAEVVCLGHVIQADVDAHKDQEEYHDANHHCNGCAVCHGWYDDDCKMRVA